MCQRVFLHAGVPEQIAAGLTNHLPSGGQHFSIFKALILNFTMSVLHFSESDHVQTTADTLENDVYIWKFMSTLAFSSLFEKLSIHAKTCRAKSKLWITTSVRVARTEAGHFAEYEQVKPSLCHPLFFMITYSVLRYSQTKCCCSHCHILILSDK